MARTTTFFNLDKVIDCNELWNGENQIVFSTSSEQFLSDPNTLFIEGDECQLREFHRKLGQAIERKWSRNK